MKRSWPNFKLLSRHSSGLRKNTKNLSQYSRSLGRDLNTGFPDTHINVLVSPTVCTRSHSIVPFYPTCFILETIFASGHLLAKFRPVQINILAFRTVRGQFIPMVVTFLLHSWKLCFSIYRAVSCYKCIQIDENCNRLVLGTSV